MKKKNGIKIVLVPESGDNPKSFNISALTFSFIKIGASIITLLFIFAIIFSGNIIRTITISDELKNENDSLSSLNSNRKHSQNH